MAHRMAPALLGALAATSLALPVLPVPDGHGVNIHFTHELPGETAQISNAGFNLVRMDMFWSDVETAVGVYNWSNYDALVDSLDSSSLSALLILNGGNPLYDNGHAPQSPEAVAAFVNFATTAVQRYRGNGFIWEMYNEPDLNDGGTNCPTEGEFGLSHMMGGWAPCANATAYTTLAIAVSTALKSNPDTASEILIGPALGQYWNATAGVLGPDFRFLNAIADGGVLEWWDGVSIHPYRPDVPENSFIAYNEMTGWLASRSPSGHVPALVNSECGYSTSTMTPNGSPLANETYQAYYTARVRLANLLSNISLSIAYDYKDDGDNASYIEDRFGLVRQDYFNTSYPHEPKPAWTAAHALHNLFYGCSFTGGLQINITGTRCYAAYWDCGFMSPAFAAWCAADDGWSANLTFPYNWPGLDAAPRVWPNLVLMLSWPSEPGQPTTAEPAMPVDGRMGGPCFYRYLWDGTDTGLVCSTGSDPSSYSWTLTVSSAPQYLRDVQI